MNNLIVLKNELISAQGRVIAIDKNTIAGQEQIIAKQDELIKCQDTLIKGLREALHESNDLVKQLLCDMESNRRLLNGVLDQVKGFRA